MADLEEKPAEQEQIVPPVVVIPKKSEHRFVLIIILVLIVVSACLYAFYRFTSRVQQLPVKEVVSQITPSIKPKIATTTLSVDVANARVSTGSVEIPIAIDTGENNVSIVELHLSYDPKQLTGVSVKPGNFYANPMVVQKNIDTVKGTIVFVLASLKPRQGTGSFVVVTGTPEAKTAVTIHIDPATKVAAFGEVGTVLHSTLDGTVQIP